MKRIIRTLGIIAMVALVATSCKKNEESASFNLAVGETYGFEAGPSLDGSKAYFDPADGYRFKWNVGDNVIIYNLDDDYTKSVAEIYTAEHAGYTTPFNVTTTEVGGPLSIGYRVFYNATMGETALGTDNKVTFTINDVQTFNPSCWADPNAMVMACTAPAVGNHPGIFTMQHIFGYLNIGVYNISGVGAKKVSSIVVQDDKWNLTGKLDLKLGPVNATTFTTLLNNLDRENPEYLAQLNSYLGTLGYHAHEQGKTVTLNCNNYNLPNAEYQYFFISLRPGALDNGFTVTINYEGGASQSYHYAANAANLIRPATFTNIYAVTEGRWGDGGTWVQTK
jgi:hypothetical protein